MQAPKQSNLKLTPKQEADYYFLFKHLSDYLDIAVT